MFFCEICKILRTPFLTEHLRWLLLYHCKWHLYRLRILLTILLDYNIILCLFQKNFISFLPGFIFSSLIPSFSFVMPSKRTQNSFTTTRQILNAFLILISYLYLFTVPLFTFNWLYAGAVWRHGVVVITAAQLYSTKHELRLCAGSNAAWGVSEIRDGEDLW